MVSALFCFVPERSHRAANLHSRNHSVGLSTTSAQKSGGSHLHRNLGEVTSPHHMDWCCQISCVALLPKFLYRALPTFEQQVCSCLLLLPCQAVLCCWWKTNQLLSWGCRRRDGMSRTLGLTPEPPSCLQHLLPPDPDWEGSTQRSSATSRH